MKTRSIKWAAVLCSSLLPILFVSCGKNNVTLSKAGFLANHVTGQIAWSNHVKILLKKL